MSHNAHLVEDEVILLAEVFVLRSASICMSAVKLGLQNLLWQGPVDKHSTGTGAGMKDNGR